MCVCVYVCMCVCVYVCMWLCEYVCKRVSVYACVCLCVCVSVCVSVCICVYMCVCVYEISSSSEWSVQGQVLHCKRRDLGCIYAEGRSSTANSGSKSAVLLELNRCGSFPLHSAPHSLFSIWTDLKRSEKIPGAPTWRWGEWIWLIGPCGLRRNSPQHLNTSSIRFLTRSNIRKSQSPFAPVWI